MSSTTIVRNFGRVSERRNARRNNLSTRESILTFDIELTSPTVTLENLREAVENVDRIVKESIKFKGSGQRRIMTLVVKISPAARRDRFDAWTNAKVSDIITEIANMVIPGTMEQPKPRERDRPMPQDKPVPRKPAFQQASSEPQQPPTPGQPAKEKPQQRQHKKRRRFSHSRSSAQGSEARRERRKRALHEALKANDQKEVQRITEMLMSSRRRRKFRNQG